jgi:NAD dependent epimerase/dehydratase family enzyme
VNVSAPNPVPNAELSKVLGRVLHRPSLLPAPGFALKALFGEGAEPLLTGQRALPRQLLEHGYTFRFSELEPALRDLLG